ncbi:hypothetical protein GYA13_02960 [Candidatus Kuenenbacteria bacterium]|nr:hypothetical protein [Candidatus Kuenenbacteria bacterium]
MTEKTFQFKKYQFNPKTGVALFDYASGEHRLREKLVLPAVKNKLSKNQWAALDSALFNLFLMAGISYYKAYCPRVIDLGKYKLNKEQATFWDKVYTKGLGEFFYQNKLDFRGLVNFPYDKNHKVKAIKIKARNESLVPIGGGKDSIVVAERLKARGKKISLFNLTNQQKTNQIIIDTAQVSGEKLIAVRRQIAPELIALNQKKGVYNGHIPFSAYLAFLTLAVAIINEDKEIALGNEKSANYGNVKYRGTIINHQWSKSLEFEKMFQAYARKFITPSIRYYSELRKFNELQIAGMFVHYPQYFYKFSSCNKNFRFTAKAQSKWCGECAKCVFVWTMLSAHLQKKQLLDIFNKNLYADRKLKPLFQELLGQKNIKPFECVGTPAEMKRALKLAKENFGEEINKLNII